MAARKHQNSNRENTAILAKALRSIDETNKVLEKMRVARDDAFNVLQKMLVFTRYDGAEQGDVQRLKALDDVMAAASAMMARSPQL
jgi:ClpP class serine protease